ncbi:hypothetical protein BU17DRAFT_89368 [Hysterangium stoloniferum]|nr:hypothetical protein BU17DRAFT_89368 [Hysterangium stoloniferum]
MVSFKYITGLLSVGLMASALSIDNLEKKQLGACNVVGCATALGTTGTLPLLLCGLIGLANSANPTLLIQCLLGTGLTAVQLPAACGGCLELPI